MPVAPFDIEDPGWFPFKLDVKKGVLQFAHLDRSQLSSPAFLDERLGAAVHSGRTIAIDELLATPGPTPQPGAFIFHTAFCCSTLVARCLDLEPFCLSLKEPGVLLDLANAVRVGGIAEDPRKWETLSNLVYALLFRRFSPDEKVLVKPTNSAGNLLTDAIGREQASTVLLYSDLESFLVSVLKKGEACRSFVRKLYNLFALDPEPLGAIPSRQAMGFTDLQVAALVWRHQMESYARALRRAPSARVRTLDCAAFLREPETALAALSEFLELGLGRDQVAATVQGPLFRRNSKFDDQPFDTRLREEEQRLVASRNREALDAILEWAATLRLGEELPRPFPAPLF